MNMRRSRAVASAGPPLAEAEALLASIKSDVAGFTAHRVPPSDAGAGAITLEWEHRAGQRRLTSSPPRRRPSSFGRRLRLIGWALIVVGVAAGWILALDKSGDGRDPPMAQSPASVRAAAIGQPQVAAHQSGPPDAEPVLPDVPAALAMPKSRSLLGATAPQDKPMLQSAASATTADGTGPDADRAGQGDDAALEANPPPLLGSTTRRSTSPRSGGTDAAGARNTKWTASFFDRSN